MTECFDKAKARFEAVIDKICDQQTRQVTIETILDKLKQPDTLMSKFNGGLQQRRYAGQL